MTNGPPAFARAEGGPYSGTAPAQEEVLLKAVVLPGLAWLGVVAVACGGANTAANGGEVVVSPVASISPSVAAPTRPAPSATPTAPATDPLAGFTYPIAGGCLPKGDQLMPNAPRPYREGIHEGVDNYDVDNCTHIGRGTDVVAAKAGRVIRADLDYRDLTAAELAVYLANPNTEEALDKFRGRQVWIEHEGGVVTRYAHLSGVAAGIAAGVNVERGQVVAYVGESGTPESVTHPGTEYHLHFEVRIGSSYLGKDLAAAEVRRLYQGLFTQP